MKAIAVIFALIFMVLCMVGCGNAPSMEDASQASSENSSSSSFQMVQDDEFVVADYQRFNSPAGENGLGGTRITFQGEIKEFKTEDDYLYYTVTTKDGDWHVGVGLDYGTPVANCETLVGENVQIFAEYSGFSSLANLPACNLMAADENGIFDERMRVVTSDGTEYPYVPYFWDWNMVLASEQGQTALKGSPSSSEATSTSIKEKEPENSSVNESEQSKLVTMGEMNALKSAKNYLGVMAFSYSGLAKQLEYEGYSAEEAAYAAEHCGADWKTQASKAAKAYLDIMPMSKQDLINQLIYEGYTTEQATYGASENGY